MSAFGALVCQTRFGHLDVDVKELISSSEPGSSAVTTVTSNITRGADDKALSKKVVVIDEEDDEEDDVDISCSVEKKGTVKIWQPSSKKPYLAANATNTHKMIRYWRWFYNIIR